MILRVKNIFRDIAHKNKSADFVYSCLNSLKTKGLSIVSDEVYGKIHYYENTGRILNLNQPRYFNEKLWWLKINNRNSLMTECSDKVKVRDYISRLGLSDILVEIYGIYSKPEDIPFEKMKGKYFIKCNHVSGINTVYDSSNLQLFNRKLFIKEFNRALKMNYYYQSREWNYKNISPRIIIENFIESPTELLDYRFLCFNGKVKLIFVDRETASINGKHNPGAQRNVYNRDFIFQDFTVGRDNFNPNLIEKPENLDIMIEYAERISSPFIFCRVDLYNNNGKIQFSEITFYPGGCAQQFSSIESDLLVSSWLEI